MVMGPTHAMSGAAAWLFGAGAVTAVTGSHLSTEQILVGAGVCAGCALLPDIDSPSSTVARSIGPITQGLAYLVSAASNAAYRLTAGPRDENREGGHRTLTHTLLFAVAVGAAVSALVTSIGTWAVAGTLFFTLSLALRGLLVDWAKKEGWIAVTLASAAAAFWAYTIVGGQSFWWLGFAVTGGMVVHDLGDMITKQGAPLLAPLPVRGKRWWEFSLPGFLRIRAGGLFEYALLLPALTVAALLGLGWVFDPDLVRAMFT